jgi:hypothetical protein
MRRAIAVGTLVSAIAVLPGLAGAGTGPPTGSATLAGHRSGRVHGAARAFSREHSIEGLGRP